MTDNQERVWQFCGEALGEGFNPTLDEIQRAIGLGKNGSDFAVKALIEAKLLKRDRMRRLEFTDVGRAEAKRRGWVERTAAEELAQAADYIEFWVGLPGPAEELRTGSHWTPEAMEYMAPEQAKRGTDAG